jgi:hypothetical protein
LPNISQQAEPLKGKTTATIKAETKLSHIKCFHFGKYGHHSTDTKCLEKNKEKEDNEQDGNVRTT